MSTPPPRKICCFLFVQEVGGGNGYSLLQMLFRMRWYLQEWDIRYRRCFLGCVGICMAGIFDIADAF